MKLDESPIDSSLHDSTSSLQPKMMPIDDSK